MIKRKLLILLPLSIILIITICTNKKPVLLGFSADLTGPTHFLGIMARDSAILAVAKVNREGGINGRELKLIIKDDKGDPETIRKVDKELIDLGVSAIIGHITSSQTAAAFEQINKEQVVLFSYSSSSNLFSRKADYFFRSAQSNGLLARAMARHIAESYGRTPLSTVYDESNIAFTGDFKKVVEEELLRQNGNIGKSYPYNTDSIGLKELSQLIADDKPELLLILASSMDTAFIAQYLRHFGQTTQFFTSSWSHGEVLIEKGGTAVEGLEIISTHKPELDFPPFLEFQQEFREFYNKEPGNITMTSYEAILIMAHSLKKTDGKREGLREALSSIENFKGIESYLTIDNYGDILRDVYILRVENGGFKLLREVTP